MYRRELVNRVKNPPRKGDLFNYNQYEEPTESIYIHEYLKIFTFKRGSKKRKDYIQYLRKK